MRYLPIIFALALTLLLAGCSTEKTPTDTPPAAIEEAKTADPEPLLNSITADELARHASASDCWVVLQGEVYDITDYLDKHPGGNEVLIAECGSTGFEAALRAKHGTSKDQYLPPMKKGTYLS